LLGYPNIARHKPAYNASDWCVRRFAAVGVRATIAGMTPTVINKLACRYDLPLLRLDSAHYSHQHQQQKNDRKQCGYYEWLHGIAPQSWLRLSAHACN
jgi:hypothetical protein